MSQAGSVNITIVGAGTIGLSFAALHFSAPTETPANVTIYDPRDDLEEYINTKLPEYLSAPSGEQTQDAGQQSPLREQGTVTVASLFSTGRLVIASSLAEAVKHADIVQEQGLENVEFKQQIWSEIESHAPSHALFWSSTSGIPASIQCKRMEDKTRLMIVHPFNPPHVMPLLEIVPSPGVEASSFPPLSRTVEYWNTLGRKPVVLKEEVTGFVANRLSFALFREAAHLVERGIASPEDVDQVVQQSLGPRWAVRGPFWSYHAGGGEERGIEGFLDKIGQTIQACWDDIGTPQLTDPKGGGEVPSGWQGRLCKQVESSYGKINAEGLRDRDEKLRDVLRITNQGRGS